MSKQEYEITAKSTEDFEIIKNKIDLLPIGVIKQILSARKNITLIYITFKKSYDERVGVILPNDIMDLSVNDKGFSCFNSTFNFEMEKQNTEQRLCFNFINIKP